MEKKKNEKANLEKTKTLFLSLGLIIVTALLISAFSWESPKIIESWGNNGPDIGVVIEIMSTTTPEPPKPKPVSSAVKTAVIDVIILRVDSSDIDSPDFVFPDDPDFTFIPEPDPIETTLDFASVMPEFPGGMPALMRFISNNIDYPALARENGLQGTVYLRFEVTKTGKIGKVELQKGVDVLIDNASIDIVKKLPKFKPGMHNGQPVNVWFSIPISFKLNTN